MKDHRNHGRRNDALEHLTGLVERVTFHSQESGFAVIRVKTRGHRGLVTVVGTLPSVTAGEWVDARGRWIVDSNYGQQFRAEALRTTPPNTLEGVERYLGSGLIKGIGPKFAGRMVKVFGFDVFDIIQNFPERLRDIEGIGPTRQARITKAWNEQRAVREIMVFLHSHGVGASRAFRIYKTYGDSAIEKVQENPYRLAHDILGIGFKTADQIAGKLGIDKQSEIRARAGVEYVLQTLTEDGHCAFPRDGLTKRAVRILEIPEPIIGAALDSEIGEGHLAQHDQPDGTTLVYLASLDASERSLARNLAALLNAPHPCPPMKATKAVEWVESRLGLSLASAQKKALVLAAKAKVMVITGGPGVGKTTLINAIVKVFRAKKLRVVLCAPTGRASKRMSETSGMTAKTIHRLLEFDPATGRFKHDQDNVLKGDIFVVDETSMIDLVLAHQLVRSIPRHAALILVGDVDQLPSVGPGSVLRDIIESGVLPVCRLTEVFRQAARSAIITNSHRVNRGNMPVWPRIKRDDREVSDFYFVDADEPEKGVEIILRLVQENIPGRFNLDPVDDIQVLTPMQRGELGARNLNLTLQKAINPSGEGIQRYGWTFRIGDKVMQIVNNYKKDVFNGDIGRVTGIDHKEQTLSVQFDGMVVEYDFGELDELILSYAVTIHKSQGSEYPCVIIPLHTQHYMLLQRNLLYTAITRGRKLVVLVGTRKALAIAVKRVEARRRVTTLKNRLKVEGAVNRATDR